MVLLDKKPSYVLDADHSISELKIEVHFRLGGNSVKASSGINGADTEAQKKNGISDSVELLYVSIHSHQSCLNTSAHSIDGPFSAIRTQRYQLGPFLALI